MDMEQEQEKTWDKESADKERVKALVKKDIDRIVDYHMEHYNGKWIIQSFPSADCYNYEKLEFSPDTLKTAFLNLWNEVDFAESFNGVMHIELDEDLKKIDFFGKVTSNLMFERYEIDLSTLYNPYLPEGYFIDDRMRIDWKRIKPTESNPIVGGAFLTDKDVERLEAKRKEFEAAEEKRIAFCDGVVKITDEIIQR